MTGRTTAMQGTTWELLGQVHANLPNVTNVKITTISRTIFLEAMTIAFSLDGSTWEEPLDLAAIGQSISLGTLDCEEYANARFRIRGSSSSYGNAAFTLKLSGDGISSSTITGTVLVTNNITGGTLLPEAPVLTAEGSDATALLDWTVPEDNGSAIVLYKLYRGTTADELTFFGYTEFGINTYENTGLINGNTYYFAVAAQNGKGTGPKSNVVAVQIGSIPEAVVLQGTPYYERTRLTWDPPDANGFPITGYKIYRTPSLSETEDFIEIAPAADVPTVRVSTLDTMPGLITPPEMDWPPPPAGGMTYVANDFGLDDLHSVTQDIMIYNEPGEFSALFLQLYDCYIDGVYNYMGLQTYGTDGCNIRWSKFGNDPNNDDVEANGDTVSIAESATPPFAEGESCVLWRTYGVPLIPGMYRSRIVREEEERQGDWFALYLTIPGQEEDLIGRIRFDRTDPDVPCTLGIGGTWTEAYNNNHPSIQYQVPYWHVAVRSFGNGHVPVNTATACYSAMPQSDIWAEEPGGYIHHELGEYGITSGANPEDQEGDFVQRYHDFGAFPTFTSLWDSLNSGTPVLAEGTALAYKIQWTAPTGSFTSFKIYRAEATATPVFAEIAELEFTGGASPLFQQSYSYVDTSWGLNPVEEGTEYLYQVRGVPTSGTGALSTAVSTAGGEPEGTVENDMVVFWDIPTTVNTDYTYMVTAVSDLGEGDDSNILEFTWGDPDPPELTVITEA